MRIKPLVLTVALALLLPAAVVASEVVERAEIGNTQTLSQRESMNKPLNTGFANTIGQSDALTQAATRLSARNAALVGSASMNKRTIPRGTRPGDW